MIENNGSVNAIEKIDTSSEIVRNIKNPAGEKPFLVYADSNDQSVIGSLPENEVSIWEPHVVSILKRILQPDSVSFDCGANIGIHTLNMSQLSPAGKVFAFEPARKTFELLKRNIASNNASNVCLVNNGVGEKKSTTNFAYFPAYSGSSFVYNNDCEAEEKLRTVIKRIVGEQPSYNIDYINQMEIDCESNTIELTTIDDFVKEQKINRLDVIKMDVEGGELYAIEGAKKTISTLRPTLITEYNLHCMEVYYQLKGEAFLQQLFEIYPFVYSIDQESHQLRGITDPQDLENKFQSGGYFDLLCSFKETLN